MKHRRMILHAALALLLAGGALGAAAPTFAAPRTHVRVRVPARAVRLQSEGEVASVLSASQFVMDLADGNALALNVTPQTVIVNDVSSTAAGGSTSAGGSNSAATSPNQPASAAIATGEYAVVTYHFTPATGAVADRIVLSTAPLPTGPVHHVRGMVTAVATGAFTLEAATGVSFTVDVLPTTRLRSIESAVGAPPTGATAATLAVGDFAEVWMRSGAGVNDAIEVNYGPDPIGLPHVAVRATVASVNGQSLALTLPDGGSLTVTVLGDARVRLNGQAATLAQLAAGDRVALDGVRFVGVYYVTAVDAHSATGPAKG
jgi:hypothetical protein